MKFIRCRYVNVIGNGAGEGRVSGNCVTGLAAANGESLDAVCEAYIDAA